MSLKCQIKNTHLTITPCFSELSLANQKVQVAQRLLTTIKKLDASENVTLVESQIYWTKGHTDIALSLLRSIVSSNVSANDNFTATSLRYGQNIHCAYKISNGYTVRMVSQKNITTTI